MKAVGDRPQTVGGGPHSAIRLLPSVQHFVLLTFYFLASCASPPQITPTQTITAYTTTSAQTWMSDLFACANERSIIVEVTAVDPDISLRIGEPETLTSPAFQIGEEEILIVTHRESPVQNLTLEEVQATFTGQGGESVQVWVYASGMDLQEVFEQVVMKGRSVTSFARVAANPQEMSDVLNSESDTIGILPKHWVVGSVREVYSLGTFPVLAVTREEPQGAAQSLLACLQNN